MNILVIDSGVKLSHPVFTNSNIESYEITDNTSKRVFYDNDNNGHGTAVCSLICKSLKRNNIVASIKVIKAFTTEAISESEIEIALRIVLDEFDVDIINMSFGMAEGKMSTVINLCKALLEKAIIVSAADNFGVLSIPCSLPGVIGVISDDSITNSYEYNFINSVPIQISAFGKRQRVAWIEPDYCLAGGNSFACANATGIIAKIVQNYGKEKFREGLETHSKNQIITYKERATYSLSIPFKIQNASIFPISKETSSLILFPDMLDFEIVDVYDFPVSGKVGSRVSQVLKLELQHDYIIRNIYDLITDNIDTLIIGHLGEYIKYPREYDRISALLKKYADKMYYYFFDPVENSTNVFSPIIDRNYVPPCIGGGMLYGINTPIVGIYGTSSKQGKFTLQLQLRQMFLQKGYSVGQIGTEPESLLFGFDSVYPMGYNSAVQLSGNDTILYLNRIVHEIEIKNDVDIIITGCQSGTVPYSFGSLNNITLPQIEFLYGTCPDAVILCINCFDEIEYILRTINFIESAVDTKVIALVLFPQIEKAFEKTGKENIGINFDIEKHCNNISNELDLPVFILGQNSNKLCDIIICYLSD